MRKLLAELSALSHLLSQGCYEMICSGVESPGHLVDDRPVGEVLVELDQVLEDVPGIKTFRDGRHVLDEGPESTVFEHFAEDHLQHVLSCDGGCV